MSDHIFGSNGAIDPLNLAIHEQVNLREEVMQSSLAYYDEGILTPGTYLADRTDPMAVTAVLGEDGEEMTLDKRQKLAKERADQGQSYLDDEDVDYRQGTLSIVTEQIGTSAQKHLLPLRIAPPPIVVETPDEQEEEPQ